MSQVNHKDKMHLVCEVVESAFSNGNEQVLKDKIAQTLKTVTKLTGSVELVPINSLPDDGKVIDEQRDFD